MYDSIGFEYPTVGIAESYRESEGYTVMICFMMSKGSQRPQCLQKGHGDVHRAPKNTTSR